MTTKNSHLHLLPWYVSGKIGLQEQRDLDGHLQECEVCRAEVASLASMMKSVRFQRRMDHIAAADLVWFEEEARSLNPGKRSPIESHLAGCPECREDLETLRQARGRESAPIPLAKASPVSQLARRGWMLAAMSAAALVLLVVWPRLFSPTVEKHPPGIVSRVVFPAPRRGPEARLTLDGTGPWSIRVVLPFDAPGGPYRVRIRATDSQQSQLDTTASAQAGQGVTVLVPGLSGPGDYEMLLTHNLPGAEDSYRYSFELLAQSSRKPAN